MSATKTFADETDYAAAPDLPEDRPPTRAEVWAYVSHVFKRTKSHDAQVAFARSWWRDLYVRWVNFRGWTKPPDWLPGQAVFGPACPVPGTTFNHRNRLDWAPLIAHLFELQHKRPLAPSTAREDD